MDIYGIHILVFMCTCFSLTKNLFGEIIILNHKFVTKFKMNFFGVIDSQLKFKSIRYSPRFNKRPKKLSFLILVDMYSDCVL